MYYRDKRLYFKTITDFGLIFTTLDGNEIWLKAGACNIEDIQDIIRDNLAPAYDKRELGAECLDRIVFDYAINLIRIDICKEYVKEGKSSHYRASVPIPHHLLQSL